MKISVIFTGGTIGSKLSGGYIGVSGCPYALIENWRRKHGGCEFDTCEPYTILSENSSFEHLCKLAACAREKSAAAEAVIITHGTDTLCYTAAFLGLALSDIKKPIVLVSSGCPLEDERANGQQNFAAAVELAKSGEAGVFAVWYADGEARVHRGVRLLPHAPYSDMLVSLPNLSETAGGFCGESEITRRFKDDPHGFDQTRRVLTLTCRPDMYYPQLTADVSAVMFESYHSGTMCADERLAEFAERAAAEGVPIFIAGAGGREAEYESVKQYRALGIIPLPAVSPTAAYVKLSIAAAYRMEIPAVMAKNCAGEYAE